MREECVPEQQRDVVVRRGEEARATVVEEVALVDRLDPEREAAILDERREDRIDLPLARRPECGVPERALRGRAGCDLLEYPVARGIGLAAAMSRHVDRDWKNDRAAAIVVSTCSSVCAVEGKRHSNCEGGR